jgi:hypothetical protein
LKHTKVSILFIQGSGHFEYYENWQIYKQILFKLANLSHCYQAVKATFRKRFWELLNYFHNHIHHNNIKAISVKLLNSWKTPQPFPGLNDEKYPYVNCCSRPKV